MMKIGESLLGMLLVAAVSLSACGVATSRQGDSAQGSAPVSEAMQETSPAAEEMADDAVPADQAMTGDAMSKDDGMMDDAESKAMGTTDESMAEDETMMGDETSKDDGMMDEAASEDAQMTGEEMSDDEMMTDDEAMATPAWYAAQLTDVNTGSTFRVADFEGKVVLVETMAVWCSTCLRQQQQVQALHGLPGERDDLVSLALDIDPNETPDVLKAHADRHGFDWHYAVAPVEVAREIGQLYGDQFLNPPSAPMLIIDRQGQVHPLPFGVKSAQVLQEALGPYLN
jgi:cytochrome oxidase Cu insertion factor (SCO1/SenC/PrrC family)